jgi:HK97 family phage major capsid protein
MAFNNLIGRADVAGLIPMEYSNELARGATEQSNVLRLARRLRDMNHKERTLPVLSALATAYFVGGDTSLVQSSEVNWKDVVITAEDLAVFVPIPRNVLNDASIPIWDEVMPSMQEAAGLAIDLATLYGTNKPASWPTDIVAGATAASHTVAENAGGGDLYDNILGTSGVFGLVENDGYMVNGSIAHLSMKAKLRGVRTTDGVPVFNAVPQTPGSYTLDGQPTFFPTNGAGSATNLLIAGDWSQLVYSVRQDMEFEVFTEGIVQDASGNIIFNLMQQRMAAVMVVMRLGFALPNPVNRVNATEATRYPFAVLTAA